MKRRVLAMVCMMFIAMSLSGCNIKFIEKVEDSSKKQSTEEQFGDIKIDSESSTDLSSTESEFNSEKETSSKDSEESTQQEEGVFSYANILFIKDESNTTYWISEDCPAKVSPSLTAKDYTLLYRGDFVTLTAVSKDNEWAMVSIYGGPSSFVKYEYLSAEEITVSQTVKPLEPSESENQSDSSSETSSEVQSESNNSQSSESQTSESSEQSSQSSSQESSYEPPVESSSEESTYAPPVEVDTYEGIPFPSNASSTSFNMGIEFADVTITLTIRKDNAVISNGPDTPSNSSGYYSIGVLNTGSTIKCTGIGRNGYVRVDYDGKVGFIDSKYTEY